LCKLVWGEPPKRQTKVQLHFYVQVVSSLLCHAGFIMILLHKNDMKALHFQTWHSWFGLAAIGTGALTQGLLGGALQFYDFLAKFLPLPKKPSIKKLHRQTASITYGLGIITILIALWSNYVQNNFATPVIWTLGVLLISLIVAVVPVAMRLTK